MKIFWILIANTAKASLYLSNNLDVQNSFELIHRWEHPESRMQRRELMADKPGHYTKNGKDIRGSYENHTDPKEVEFQKFAKEISEFLEKERSHSPPKFNALFLIVPPHFYGELEKNFSKHLNEFVKDVLEKDIVFMKEKELKDFIQEYRVKKKEMVS